MEEHGNQIYEMGPWLQKINAPEDIRLLNPKSLQLLADDVRQYIIDVVSQIGNSHFSASLGVVELAVALHYVYNTPDDKLIWDVGHQAYAHKILTGRKEMFPTNRSKGGISGFPKMKESPYDAFGTGHSSTSISALLGMYHAWKIRKGQAKAFVAVIGDGAMTAGMAYEALNHAGETRANMTIILNDNDASIDPNQSGLQRYLNRLQQSKSFQKWQMQNQGKGKLRQNVKHRLWQESNFFESLGIQYFGPIDGHDIKSLVWHLKRLKEIEGPKLLHIKTKKGKGYAPAETGDLSTWHAPGVFNKETGEILKITPKSDVPPKFQEVFGQTIVELAEENEKICAITPAMISGASLQYMQKAMPDRVFDVAIAEQHAVTFAAGMAAEGVVPFCHIYSTFLQRGYDQFIHDVALQNLPVVFCIDRAGLVGADGSTHHGAFDLAYMNAIPNVVIAAPMHEHDLRNMMLTASQFQKGPFCIRFPRGAGKYVQWKNPMKKVTIGKGVQLSKGDHLAILSIGKAGLEAEKAVAEMAAKDVRIAHYDMRFLKPLDTRILHEVGSQFEYVITVEDGVIKGGFGAEIINFFNENNYPVKVTKLGIPDTFVSHGTTEELMAECGYDMQGIVKRIISILGLKSSDQGQLNQA